MYAVKRLLKLYKYSVQCSLNLSSFAISSVHVIDEPSSVFTGRSMQQRRSLLVDFITSLPFSLYKAAYPFFQSWRLGI